MAAIENNLWVRWTLANALSELVGLGATFGGIAYFVGSLKPHGTIGTLLIFASSILSGAVEATVVGLAQWWAMRRWFPKIRALHWWRATLIGALAAYALGFLPSTLSDLWASDAPAPQSEPKQWLTLLFAIGLGLVAGAVLSFAQWLELRKHHKKAGIWIPANMLAWACGMPVVFFGSDLALQLTDFWQKAILMGVALLTMGTLVGAIHGYFLLKLAENRGQSGTTSDHP